MVSNLINGQIPVLTESPEKAVHLTPVEPRLTLATIIMCLVGPFWLIYRLITRVFKISSLNPDRIKRATE